MAAKLELYSSVFAALEADGSRFRAAATGAAVVAGIASDSLAVRPGERAMRATPSKPGLVADVVVEPLGERLAVAEGAR